MGFSTASRVDAQGVGAMLQGGGRGSTSNIFIALCATTGSSST